jgi:hypothetical protein
MIKLHHAGQCGWHCDQYDFECDCGVTRPATTDWAEREVSAAESSLVDAYDRVKHAKARLASFASKPGDMAS